MGKAETVYLDRWHLKVTKNTEAPPVSEEANSSHSHPIKDNLPLNVVNNYFSFGVDADIALQFHEARGKLFITTLKHFNWQFFGNFYRFKSISIATLRIQD